MVDSASNEPVELVLGGGGVLAVITGVEGSAYRTVGAAMGFRADGVRAGSLTSGCIEEALALEAEKAYAEDSVRHLRYGKGSPWIDIRLPCGAGLDVGLWPVAKNAVFNQTSGPRRSYGLFLPRRAGGSIHEVPLQPAGWQEDGFLLPRVPPLRFVLVGTGLETLWFARIASAAGYEVTTISPDPLVLTEYESTLAMEGSEWAHHLEADEQTALVFLFHDHDQETPILKRALAGDSFWIGAQGSKKAQAVRSAQLLDAGLDSIQVERLRTKIGLIPAARDPQTLAISVLADAVAAYKQAWFDPFFLPPSKDLL